MKSFSMDKRDFLRNSLVLGMGMGLSGTGVAQTAAAPARASASTLPVRRVKSTLLFKTPEGYPNALAASPEGLWIGEQKPESAVIKTEKALLVDWKGKLLRTVVTQARNTSGMAYGDGCIWMGANAPPQGIFQTDMNSRTISHRQIPLGPPADGGGCHGALYHEGKLWIMSTRLRGILRVDPKSWEPEFLIPTSNFTRTHDIAWDNGAIWMITGTSNKIPENQAGLAKYDATTGRLLETALFEPGSADPHGLEMHDGALYSCDAGIGPGFVETGLPSNGYIFRIDFI